MIVRSRHEIKSEIQQKHGIHIDIPINNKNKTRVAKSMLFRFLENDVLQVIFQ